MIKDEYQPRLEEMRKWDSHDLVKPDTWFPNVDSVLGFVYLLLLKEIREEIGLCLHLALLFDANDKKISFRAII